MKARMNPVTNGPVVSDRLETSVSGVFACGNVLHVHDLVDYVSEEAKQAGENAAAYVRGVHKCEKAVPIVADGGVRYTVPQHIDPAGMADKVVVRFRVADVYRDRYICVYLNDERIQKKKKRIMAPGEMEQVVLDRAVLDAMKDLREIRICTEVE